MKKNKVITEVLVEANSKSWLSKNNTDYKAFEFDMKDVTAIADSVWPGHTDIVIPGGVFTIKVPYQDFIITYNFYNETKKN